MPPSRWEWSANQHQGVYSSEPVEGQLEVPPLQEEVVELVSGDGEVPEDVPMDPEPSPQTGPHSLPLPSVPISVAQEEHEQGEPVLETPLVGSVTQELHQGWRQHSGDTLMALRGSGTADQVLELGTLGEGLLHDTSKPPDGALPYHRMVGRASGLLRLTGRQQHALVVTFCHSFRSEADKTYQRSSLPHRTPAARLGCHLPPLFQVRG